MMERIYKCNVCREECEQRHLLGIYWDQKSWIQKAVQSVENHVCLACAKDIRNILNQHETGVQLKEMKHD